MKRFAPALLIVWVMLAGCAPTYKKLPTLEQVPELKTLSERSEARQIRLWKLPVGENDGTPYSIVAEETGAERTDVLVVLVHGLVSDRTTGCRLCERAGSRAVAVGQPRRDPSAFDGISRCDAKRNDSTYSELENSSSITANRFPAVPGWSGNTP